MGFVFYVILIIIVISVTLTVMHNSIMTVDTESKPPVESKPPIESPPTNVVVTGTPDRQANQNGWYTSPLTITWTGRDNFGNLMNDCQSPTYSGPEGAGISVIGYCNDNTGKSWSGNFVLNYDSTPPTFPTLTATDNFNNKLNDGDSTASNIVNFYFTSTDNLGDVYYMCRLDSKDFSVCTSPNQININSNQESAHNIQVISYDKAGNTYGKSAFFSWKYYIIG